MTLFSVLHAYVCASCLGMLTSKPPTIIIVIRLPTTTISPLAIRHLHPLTRGMSMKQYSQMITDNFSALHLIAYYIISQF